MQINDSEDDSESSDREDDVEMSNKFSSKILSAPAEASLRSFIGEKRNTEEKDEEKDDYSSEEDDEPAITNGHQASETKETPHLQQTPDENNIIQSTASTERVDNSTANAGPVVNYLLQINIGHLFSIR
ncbi:hypothetical protein HHI36_004733 [Cryptolaemus montrouzieri]|uniref:Uncharacterized protein n=1 Tax=Cryptolaemus montrouzieri TaxID=559131 RepID=A0ABD2NTM7_9CUCU